MKKKPARPKKAAAKKAAPRRAAKKAPARKAARRAKAAAKPATPLAPKSGIAHRMAAFSAKVLQEEEAPVAVRSFVEARQGVDASKTLLPKTGEVTAVDEGERARPEEERDEPRLQPLAGEVSVSKPVPMEFKVQAPKKKARLDTPEDFGPVELRQATASGGRHITRALPENLQRAASRIEALTGTDEAGKPKKKSERFQVGSAAASQAPLTDFGDVEIEQQTLSGSKKVGKLQKKKDEESEE